MMHDTELLQYVYKTTDMGCKGIESVQNYVQSTALKDQLREQKEEYQKIRAQAQSMLAARNEPPKSVGAVAEISADVMAAGKIMVNHTDSKIAEMTIQGNQMGVNKTIKHLHDYSGNNDIVRSLTQKLLATEEANAEQLKRYL
ncbi:MAG: hypothetical protein E7L17_05800 [Clostridium sp.]|uniref:hypothetical protein n=1 Tax=Clostridium sp. TaxID=1506 RepID=UPI002911F4B7|nr:hypothetical protein [Clostridium sp.]MDU7337613.1 hypothetical protein [Clostridium sp.]